ncbi:hypothetical protein EUAN_16740 [Andreesenia angusta]|uniref:Uncharacterized protein n=1 Tax=Andreesenia angusta TaxID=39480 RepID=A0A1S1V5I0_9FIRM|nr:DUF6042 family protein [Andreesenia angusta]OHW61911.1 hypothetical protein EUAN_16740 [Andreesenia angusta]
MKIEIPRQIGDYLWTRYLPESTYKTYVLIGYLNNRELSAEDYSEELMNVGLGEDKTLEKVVAEKRKVLEKLGIEYPENRTEDVALLKQFGLIEAVDGGKYKYVEEIKRPEEVLDLDEEEKSALEDIKFEVKHDRAINMILSLVLTNGKLLDCTVEHITNMTKVKIADIRTVLDFLVNKEKSLRVQSSKDISKLKKGDRVRITVNEEVFNEKRFIL